MDKINTCFYEQTIKVAEIVFEKMDKKSLNLEEFKDSLKEIFNNVEETKQKPEIKKRGKKELNKNEQCTALKKDGK